MKFRKFGGQRNLNWGCPEIRPVTDQQAETGCDVWLQSDRLAFFCNISSLPSRSTSMTNPVFDWISTFANYYITAEMYSFVLLLVPSSLPRNGPGKRTPLHTVFRPRRRRKCAFCFCWSFVGNIFQSSQLLRDFIINIILFLCCSWSDKTPCAGKESVHLPSGQCLGIVIIECLIRQTLGLELL